MSPEKQRIAIAEACGWREVKSSWEGQQCFGYKEKLHGYVSRVPDYLNDLNAMHEAEKTLLKGYDFKQPAETLPESWDSYCYWLAHITGLGEQDHATAAQRAEAFLRTLNLWQD